MIISSLNELCIDHYIGKRRALCLDYGDKRIGVAISDIGWEIASPLTVINSNGAYGDLFKIISDYAIGVIVIGAPMPLNGGIVGKQLSKVQKFTEKLDEMIQEKCLDIKILYWDERLSTVAANRYLTEAEMSKSNKKKNIDKVSASFILDGAMCCMQNSKKRNF